MRLVRAVLAGGVLAFAWTGAVLAEGILPTPFPGVETGVDPRTLFAVATTHTLTCTDVGTDVDCHSEGMPQLTMFFPGDDVRVATAAWTGPNPLPDDAAAFLAEIGDAICAGGGTGPFFLLNLHGDPNAGRHLQRPGVCDITVQLGVGEATSQLNAVYHVGTAPGVGEPTLPPEPTSAPTEPAATAVVGPSPSTASTPAPAASAAPGSGSGEGSSGAGPGAFASSIVTPAALPLDPPALVQALALVALALLLIPFPATLFNSTLESNYDEVRGWFRWVPRFGQGGGLGAFWKGRLGVLLFLAISAVLYALLDPGLGLNVESLVEVVAIAIGIVITTAIFSIPNVLAHRRAGDGAWKVEVKPGTIFVAVACVLVSRLAQFAPGYLYGLLLGLTFGRDLTRDQEGRLNAVASLAMIAMGIAAWLGLAAVPDGGDPVSLAVRTVLASIMVGGLEGAAIGLVPLRFQPGAPVLEWNKLVWVGAFAISMLVFALLLINPASGYLADSSQTPLITIVALLVGFGFVSVAFWGYFRFRPARPATPTPAEGS